MSEGELKIPKFETAENESETRKKRFFSGLKNRLLALATAGFITLGAGWASDLYRQLEIEEKKEVFTEFILKNEITENALFDFRSKVEKEEPEFTELLEEYGRAVETGLDNLEKEILGQDINGSSHQDSDQRLIDEQQQQWAMGNYQGPDMSWVISKDHDLLQLIRSEPELLKSSHNFLKSNLDDILWGIALLNDSRDSREAMTHFIRPPTLVFSAHNSRNLRATTEPLLLLGQWHPKITVYPASLMNSDRKFDRNTYINILIHELNHAALAGSGEGKRIVIKIGGIDFATVLDEGRTQALTYKVIDYINGDNPNFKPIIGEAGEYDQNLVIAEIVESVARIHPNSDFLVEWQMGIIDNQKMLDNLQVALNDLGFNKDIPKLLADFKYGEDRVKSSTGLLNDLLTKLKIGNIDLSDGFVRSILEREQK